MIIGVAGNMGVGKDTFAKILLTEIFRLYVQQSSYYKGRKYTSYELLTLSPENIRSILPSWEIKKFAGFLKEISASFLNVDVSKFEDAAYKNSTLPPQWSTYELDYIDEETGKEEKFVAADYESVKNFAKVCDESLTDEEIKANIRHVTMTVRSFLQKMGTEAIRLGLHPNAWVNKLMSEYNPSRNWIVTDVRFPNEADAIRNAGGIIIKIERGSSGNTSSYHDSERALEGYRFDYTILNSGTLEDLRYRIDLLIPNLVSKNIIKINFKELTTNPDTLDNVPPISQPSPEVKTDSTNTPKSELVMLDDGTIIERFIGSVPEETRDVVVGVPTNNEVQNEGDLRFVFDDEEDFDDEDDDFPAEVEDDMTEVSLSTPVTAINIDYSSVAPYTSTNEINPEINAERNNTGT